ncbi:hypothetical protein [Spiroplasma endosymbiont of Cantharis nigra]|uniref:hypothetical protein n=1 Tax=Spiroplasma endosymbiont of Cantharis nigra TaxID=3066278 RepID=UPI0030CE24D3
MNSIYTRIDNLGRENRNTVFRIISRKILEDFSNGVFRSQEDLAYISNCSKATITAFSKAALVSGYRELQIRLKIEYENNFTLNKSNEKLIDNKAKNDFFLNNQYLEKWTVESYEQISNFFLTNLEHKIQVFSGYQTLYSTNFLEDVLQKNNIDVWTLKLDKDIISIKNINYEKVKSIFILSGRDTNSLKGFFEYVYNKNSNIIVIASLNWEKYLQSKKAKAIFFDNEHFNRNYIDRNFQLIYLWKYLDYQMSLIN